MTFRSPQQSRTTKGGYKPLHANTDKPLRKICRLSFLVEQNIEPPNNSVQQETNPPSMCDSSGQRQLSRRISSQREPAPAPHSFQNEIQFGQSNQIKMSKEEFENFPRFGPSYGEDAEAIKAYKEAAWNHVLHKTLHEHPSILYGHYLGAIKRIENEARETYDPPIVNRLIKSKFQWMMIKDGCYFLQLALYILGGSELLDYPENYPDLGTRDREAKISRWIKAMFLTGNQIPYVVISELMKQRFFQEVIEKGIQKNIWPHLPIDLPKMVLYLLVVAPALESINAQSSSWVFSKLKRQEKAPYFRETPSDILHGLHCLVLGLGSDPLDWEAFDPEAGTKGLERRFPSATEVEYVGVKLARANQGIREIKFSKNYFLSPILYVPPFTFDGNTELLLQCLQSYEKKQNIHKCKREVTAYLRFMSDLIQTESDVKILKSRGIIEVADEHVHELPAMLNNLRLTEQISLTEILSLTRLQIINYSVKTRNLISLAALLFCLTLVQTAYTVLSFHRSRR